MGSTIFCSSIDIYFEKLELIPSHSGCCFGSKMFIKLPRIYICAFEFFINFGKQDFNLVILQNSNLEWFWIHCTVLLLNKSTNFVRNWLFETFENVEPEIVDWNSQNLKPTANQEPLTTDTQWRHKSNLGQCGRQNMLRLYLTIWDWDWIFGLAVKAISSLGVRSQCWQLTN